MPSSSGPTTQQAEVVNGVLPSIAVVITSFRLFERIRQGRLWLDDAWAMLSMIFNLSLMTTHWLYLGDYAQISAATNVALYYTVVQLFYATVWASRISILFTIVRVTVLGSLRKILLFIFMAFLVMWMVLCAQVFWTCEAEPGWKTQSRPQCDLGRNVAIAQIITNVLSDATLILVPFRLVYKVRLTRAQNIRIISIFSASAITTVVGLVHAYYVLSYGGVREIIAAISEESVSLIVANLSVVVALLFRIGSEDTAKFSPKEFASIITVGSRPVRKRVRQDPLMMTTVAESDVEASTTTPTERDDLGMHPKKFGEPTDGTDAEVLITVIPELSPDV